MMALGDPAGERKVLNNLGLLRFREAAFTEAEEFMRRGLKSVPEDSPSEAVVFHQNLAALAHLQGRYDKALEFYHRALKGLDAEPSPALAREIHINRALLLVDMGCGSADLKVNVAVAAIGAQTAADLAAYAEIRQSHGRAPRGSRRLSRSVPSDGMDSGFRWEILLETALAQGEARGARDLLGQAPPAVFQKDRLRHASRLVRLDLCAGRVARAMEAADRLLAEPALALWLPLRLQLRLCRIEALDRLRRPTESAEERLRARQDLDMLLGRTPPLYRQRLSMMPRFAGVGGPEPGAPSNWLGDFQRLHAELAQGGSPVVMLQRLVQFAVEAAGGESGWIVTGEQIEGSILAQWPLGTRLPSLKRRSARPVPGFELHWEGQPVARLEIWRSKLAPPDMEALGGLVRPWGVLVHVETAARARLQENREMSRLQHDVRRARTEQEVERDLAMRLIEAERRQEDSAAGFDTMVCQSNAMRRVCAQLRALASNSLTVHIQGESGTGKELVARAIHHEGSRHAAPFVAVNAAALPESLAEAELFGHRRGAFTGADHNRRGAFELANGGTLLLDEVDLLPPGLQSKLLRAVQERSFRPLGAEREVSVDIRIVSASNRNLKELVEARLFREDLYYRLTQASIILPPLRDRREDIPHLIRHFEQKHGRGRRLEWSAEAWRLILDSPWPGNIRQLENEIQRLLIMVPGRIETGDLSPPIRQAQVTHWARSVEGDWSLRIGRIERVAIEEALAKSGGNKAEAARLLGISRQRLHYRLKHLGIVPR